MVTVDLYIVRHGQTDANTRSENGGPTVPLNEHGKVQASLLRESKSLPQAPDFIFSSPHERAAQTAKIATGRDDLIYCELLEERNFGKKWEGATWNTIFKRMDGEFDQNSLENSKFIFVDLRAQGISVSVDGIESSESLWKRCKDFLHMVAEKATCDMSVIAFTHSSTISVMMKYIRSLDSTVITVCVHWIIYSQLEFFFILGFGTSQTGNEEHMLSPLTAGKDRRKLLHKGGFALQRWPLGILTKLISL